MEISDEKCFHNHVEFLVMFTAVCSTETKNFISCNVFQFWPSMLMAPVLFTKLDVDT